GDLGEPCPGDGEQIAVGGLGRLARRGGARRGRRARPAHRLDGRARDVARGAAREEHVDGALAARAARRDEGAQTTSEPPALFAHACSWWAAATATVLAAVPPWALS